MGSKSENSEAPSLWPPRPLLCTPYWIRYEIRRIVTITPYWGSNTAYCATKLRSGYLSVLRLFLCICECVFVEYRRGIEAFIPC